MSLSLSTCTAQFNSHADSHMLVALGEGDGEQRDGESGGFGRAGGGGGD